ncbi:Transcriptional adapter ada2 [Rhizophlyctis rosea]|nr:Transcriptional adapter ada2 [Rhizophlyctis rosea]
MSDNHESQLVPMVEDVSTAAHSASDRMMPPARYRPRITKPKLDDDDSNIDIQGFAADPVLPTPPLTCPSSPLAGVGTSIPVTLQTISQPPLSKSNKRKSAHPSRSIAPIADESERYHEGIIKLDVYTLYIRNPRSLLYDVPPPPTSVPTSTIPRKDSLPHHPQPRPTHHHHIPHPPVKKRKSEFDSEVKEEFIIRVEGDGEGKALGARPMTRRALASLKGGKRVAGGRGSTGAYGVGNGSDVEYRESGYDGPRNQMEGSGNIPPNGYSTTPTSFSSPFPPTFQQATNHSSSLMYNQSPPSYRYSPTSSPQSYPHVILPSHHTPIPPTTPHRRSSIANLNALGVPPLNVEIDWENYMDTRGAPNVVWKGTPSTLTPETDENFHRLTMEELRTCAVLRLTPTQYLHIKATFLSAAKSRGTFRKKDAQRWFKMDVNKTCILYDWFLALGWIPSPERKHGTTATLQGSPQVPTPVVGITPIPSP